MQLYLVRNTQQCGGGYTLCNYIPYAPSENDTFLCWWFYGHDRIKHAFSIVMHSNDAEHMVLASGQKLDYGQCLNLTTGQLTDIQNAPKLPLQYNPIQ